MNKIDACPTCFSVSGRSSEQFSAALQEGRDGAAFQVSFLHNVFTSLPNSCLRYSQLLSDHEALVTYEDPDGNTVLHTGETPSFPSAKH